MATVFEAEHVRLGRRVAVKVLGPHLDHDDVALARFTREAEIVSQLSHPHIVSVLDFDVTAQGQPYLVLELLEGKALDQLLDEERYLTVRQATDLALQMASGLAAAHRAGIIHRDLKPGNVFVVDAAGEGLFVKLLDFGISKTAQHRPRLTRACQLVGTPEYMSPEQASGETHLVDERADLYALGLVTYEMVTGDQPFFADDVSSVLRKVMSFTPPRASSVAPWVPKSIDGVLARALAKRPEDRFGSALEFADALADAAGCDRLHASAGLSTSPVHSLGAYRTSASAACGDSLGFARALRPSAVTRAKPRHPRSRLRSPPCGRTDRLARAAEAPYTRPARHLVASIERVRVALQSGAIAEAVEHAESALQWVASASDPATLSLAKRSEALFERVYRQRLGPKERLIVVEHALSSERLNLSPRTAFLLSRLEGGVTVEEALDVAAMPRLDALRALVHLAASGAIRLVASG